VAVVNPAPSESEESALRAAQWLVRRDRGLSNAEAIEFELWLAADPRHVAAMERAGAAWSRLNRVPDTWAQRELAGLAAKRRQHRRRWLTGIGLAAAAALGAAFTFLSPTAKQRPASSPSALVAAGPRVVTLADGTLVRLNFGGEVIEDFDAAERRVRLTRGEAHFTVVKNSTQPFVVVAGALRVRAVGTAFNVNLQTSHIEVLVTEGRVQLTNSDATATPEPVLEQGQRAVLANSTSPRNGESAEIVVTRVDAAQMTRALEWHDSLVRLGGATLAELAADFERRFGQKVRFADPAIAQMRAGGRFRGDDAEGFANLLATTFDLDVEQASDGSWLLRKKTTIRDSGR
jgi:transmembrane sensor